MTIDERGRRAAEALHRAATPDPTYTELALRAEAEALPARQQRVRRVRAAVGGVMALAVVGLSAVALQAGGAGIDTDDTALPTSTTPTPSTAIDDVLENMPASPIDGRASWRLPVLAEPRTGLEAGDVITVFGRGFDARESVGIVQCSREAETLGVEACQLSFEGDPEGEDIFRASHPDWNDDADPTGEPVQDPTPEPVQPTRGSSRVTIDEDDDHLEGYDEGTFAGGGIPLGGDPVTDDWPDDYHDPFGAVTYAETNADGDVEAEVVVRRFITTPAGGRIDCQEAAERCIIAIGATIDYDRSGGSYIDFAGAPPFPETMLRVEPASELTPDQTVAVDVTSLPFRPVRIEQCIGDTCQTLLDGSADEEGRFAAEVVVPASVTDRDDPAADPVPCGSDCVIRAVGIGIEGASSAPSPDPVSIDFLEAPDPGIDDGTTVPSPPEQGPDPDFPEASGPGSAPTTFPETEAATATSEP